MIHGVFINLARNEVLFAEIYVLFGTLQYIYMGAIGVTGETAMRRRHARCEERHTPKQARTDGIVGCIINIVASYSRCKKFRLPGTD